MRQDLLLDTNNDLQIVNNDFVIGDSDKQHALLLFTTNKGDWTQFPQTGIGIKKYLKTPVDGEARREVNLQFEADGYKIKQFDFNIETGNLIFEFQ